MNQFIGYSLRKPFENGSGSQLISISLKFSIHGFESMDEFDNLQIPLKFSETCPSGLEYPGGTISCQIGRLRIL